MKIAALILGILAGLSGLVVAAFASAMISLASFGGLDSGAVALMRIIVFALPVASFVAAGLSMQRTRAALWIFAGVSAVWLLIGLQIGSPINFVNATPLLFGVAAAALCYFAEFPMDATNVAAPASPRAAAQMTPPPRRPAPQFRALRAIPDAEKWNALVRFDEDIRASADRLAPFGQRWVDELAAAYMAIGDKSYLPKIETRLRAEAEEEKARLDAEAEAARERAAKRAEADRIRSEQLAREAERIRAEKVVRSEVRRKAFEARVSEVRSSAAVSLERLRQHWLPVAISVAALLLLAGAYAGYSGGYFDRLLSRNTPVAQGPSAAPEQKPAPQSGPEQSKNAPQMRQEKPAAVAEQRGWLGIAMRQVTAEIAENLRLPAVRGVIVVETYENGPARKNGILVGDVITHINGQEILAAEDLAQTVSNLKPGATAIVVLLRANTQLALAVGIELRPDPMPQPRAERQ